MLDTNALVKIVSFAELTSNEWECEVFDGCSSTSHNNCKNVQHAWNRDLKRASRQQYSLIWSVQKLEDIQFMKNSDTSSEYITLSENCKTRNIMTLAT